MEAGCLRACRGHPSIIGIHGVAADPKTGDVHLILELIEGGLSLRDSFWETLSEDAIRGMMRQLIGAAKKSNGKPHQPCPVGTLQYNAPELLDGNWYYGSAIDMWGLGCVMAELLSGKLDPECLKDLSEDGHDLLRGLLTFCPEKRLTAEEALEHRWFNKEVFN
ncbi:hypothetical protein BDA96_10G140200 [Sorghum bicolor]|nr:hypothetical protein BDA96_10G140200 [Sorghum bicolor]